MRKLKYHEKKLLKKVDLFHWKAHDNINENIVMRKFHIQARDDYVKYNKLRGMITKLANELSLLPPDDLFRKGITDNFLTKLLQTGLIPIKKDLNQCENVTVSSFCRRRLPVMLMKLKMSETMKEATTFIEQGHIRVGTEVITDPAFFVPKHLEDYITWVDSSKIKRKIMEYNDRLDDYDLLQG